MLKLIIAGSRGITTLETVTKVVEEFINEKKIPLKNLEIVSGAARGVDQLGEAWALKNKVQVKRFPANWDKFGLSAGYKRNVEMANYSDCLIALNLNNSRGTTHMSNTMREKEKSTRIAKFQITNGVLEYSGQETYFEDKLDDLLRN